MKNRKLCCLAPAVLLSLLALQVPSHAQSIYTVTNTANSGTGSLRWAISQANLASSSEIRFAIPTTDAGYNSSTGVWNINPTAELPAITSDFVTIRGNTQTASMGNTNPSGPEIVLGGASVTTANPMGTVGIKITADYCAVNLITVCRFKTQIAVGDGITYTNHGEVNKCYLGTNYAGVPLASSVGQDVGIGIYNSDDVKIVGNLISGNNTGVSVNSNDISGDNISVQGNTITSNFEQGIFANLDASADISISPNVVDGNIRNVISGNGLVGVEIYGGTCLLSDNYIGTNSTGNAVLGSQLTGVMTVGNKLDAELNVVAGNIQKGFYYSGDGNGSSIIHLNKIGLGADGVTALGSDYGIHTAIGLPTIQYNTIANCDTGVGVHSGGATIRANSIYNISGLGIDLGLNGVTPNDNGDGDTGPSNLQNFPVISSATQYTVGTSSTLTINGTINTNTGQTVVIDFYRNPTSSASGEGRVHLGSTSVYMNLSTESFSYSAASALGGTQYITATATVQGRTSEFSAPVQLVYVAAQKAAAKSGEKF